VSLWRQVTHGLRVLLRGAEADRDTDEEVQHFLTEAVSEEAARGGAADRPWGPARLAFENPTSVREEIRSHGWEHHVATALADLRYAARGLRRRPGFATIAVLTLALGIGSSTAIFSAVYPILIAPLPYRDAGRVMLLSDYAGGDNQTMDVTYGTFLELAQRSRSFAELAAADRWQPALVGLAEPERVAGQLVTPRYFHTLGVTPVAGRDFNAADDLPGAPRVAIVSDGLVRRRLGGARAAAGQTIQLDGNEYTVIGVMPPAFDDVLNPSADVWAPRRYQANMPFASAEWGHHMRMVGRLAPGVSLARARAEIAAIGRTPSSAFPRPPWAAMTNGLDIEPLQGAVARDVRPALLAILAAVALVLAIAAVNVTNLLLARGAQRKGEIALRAILGAGRRRIVRQLLTESLLLAVLGGALGIAVAAAGLQALVALAPAGLPRASAIALNGAALTFAVILTATVGVVVGIAPALRSARSDLHAEVRSGARTIAGTHHALRRGLVIVEVGLALVVLVGASLMLRSLVRLFGTAPGFDAAHVLTMQVDAAGQRYDSAAARYQFFTGALAAVRSVPGVTDAAFTSQLPLSGDLYGYGVALESAPQANPNGLGSALRYAVTPGWFHTMGIPLKRGRLLNEFDRPGTTEAIVVSESFARHKFGDRDPLGQRLRFGPEIGDDDRPWDVVVGVVGDVKQASLALGAEDAFYLAMGQGPWVDNVQSLAVRTARDPAVILPVIQHAIWSVDAHQPITRIATMRQLVDRSEAQRRFVLTVFAAFGLAALALAAIGVFGLISGGVTERTSEIGVRSALGASRSSIVALVLRQGIGVAVIGSAFGLVGAVVVSGMLRTLLFGTSRADLTSYGGATALVVLVALVASAFPAWRAARVDPATILRT
jgi:putative ABC transport system permease protein